MTEGQLRRARKLIRRLCANYDEGNCLALDEGEGCVCVQSISYSLLCRYFKEAVLPADAELCAAIGQGADELKRCRSCGKPFQARSNRAATGGRCNAFGAGKPRYFKAFPAPFVRCRMFSPEPLKTVFETVTFPPPQGMSFLPLRGPIFSGKELNPHG